MTKAIIRAQADELSTVVDPTKQIERTRGTDELIEAVQAYLK